MYEGLFSMLENPKSRLVFIKMHAIDSYFLTMHYDNFVVGNFFIGETLVLDSL